MIVVNKTDSAILVKGHEVKARDRYELSEMCFNTCDIITEKGGIEIITEYSQRSFKKLGSVQFRQTNEKDEHGMRVIEIL